MLVGPTGRRVALSLPDDGIYATVTPRADLDDADARAVTRASRAVGIQITVLSSVLVLAVLVAAFAFGFINIDQVKTAKLPDVQVEATGGQAPAFDVETADINVGTKEESVAVPTVEVGTKDTSVTLPTVSVDKVGDANRSDK